MVDRQKPCDGHHVALGAALDADAADRGQLVVSLLEPAGPGQGQRVDERRPEDDRHIQRAVVGLHRPVQRVLVQAAAALKVHMHRPGQRGAGDRRHAELLGQLDRITDVPTRIVELADAVQRERQSQQHLHHDRRDPRGVVEGAAQQFDRLGVFVLVHPHGGQQARRHGAQHARFHRRSVGEQGPGPGGVAGQKVVLRRLHSAQHRVTTEPQSQIDELSGRCRRPARPCGVRSLVERREDLLVAVRRRQRQVTGSELGLGFQRGQPTVHRAARRRAGVAVDATGQQRVGEPHPVTVEAEDARRLGALHAARELIGIDVVGLRQQLDRRVGEAGHAQQQRAFGVVERRNAPPHQIGEGGGERLLGAGLVVLQRARQFQGEKRVAAGGLGDPQHRRTGERAAQTIGDHRVQLPGVHRLHRHPAQTVGPVELQPACDLAVPGGAPLGHQHTEGAVESACRELDGGTAGAVQPLRVVDCQQHRGPVVGLVHVIEDGDESRGHHPLIGRGAFGACAQQHPVQGQALQCRQRRKVLGVHLAEQVGQRGERHHRFRLADPRGQHAEAAGARLAQQRQPQGGLPDAGLALDHQRGGPVRHRIQESSNLGILDRTQASGGHGTHHRSRQRPLHPIGHSAGAARRSAQRSETTTLPLAVRSSNEAIAAAASSSGNTTGSGALTRPDASSGSSSAHCCCR